MNVMWRSTTQSPTATTFMKVTGGECVSFNCASSPDLSLFTSILIILGFSVPASVTLATFQFDCSSPINTARPAIFVGLLLGTNFRNLLKIMRAQQSAKLGRKLFGRTLSSAFDWNELLPEG